MKLFGRKKKSDDKTEYESLRDEHGGAGFFFVLFLVESLDLLVDLC